MNKAIYCMLRGFFAVRSLNSKAQNQESGGNTLTANGVLGTTTNFSILFTSDNKEPGRLTNNGQWGFGGTNPDSKVHNNGAARQVPLRVDTNKESGSAK